LTGTGIGLRNFDGLATGEVVVPEILDSAKSLRRHSSPRVGTPGLGRLSLPGRLAAKALAETELQLVEDKSVNFCVSPRWAQPDRGLLSEHARDPDGRVASDDGRSADPLAHLSRA